MKTYVLKFRTQDRANFLELKRGLKTVETRAATDRYRRIAAGDTLIITCGKDRLKKKVKTARHFKTLGALLKTYKLHSINPSLNTAAEARARWASYPGYTEKIKRYGIMAWEI